MNKPNDRDKANISGPPEPQPAPPLIELLAAPPPVMRRPLALVAGRAYAAAWLPVRITTTEGRDKAGNLVQYDPPIVKTSTRRFVIRDDGLLFGDGGDAPIDALDIDVLLPERPRLSHTWSTEGMQAYCADQRPDPAAVLNRVADVVSRFVDFDRSLANQRTMAEMVACYVLATWFLPAFNVIGYLWPSGERGSGKTVLLHTVAEMAYLGQVILAGGSYASLRDLAEYGATLAFDDAENLSNLRKTDPDKRALLLAGNRRGSTVTMKEQSTDKGWRTRHVNAFCPRLFSAIHLPDNILATRSIVIPLIRTSDRYRANADPLDHEAWPHDRRRLIDDLWGLALAHLPELREYEHAVNDRARLTGRTLEPWRAILAVALWVDDQDAQGVLRRRMKPGRDPGWEKWEEMQMLETEETNEMGLWERIETLSVRYQRERPDLESDDLTVLVIRALCYCAVGAIRAISANMGETPSHLVFTTEEIVVFAKAIARINDGNENYLTNRRVGRVLGRMRLRKAPRPGGKGGRRWWVTLGDLQRWTAAYGLPLPAILAANDTNSTTGDDGPSCPPHHDRTLPKSSAANCTER